METSNQLSSLNNIKDELRHGKIINAVIGFTILSMTIYAFTLSIKVNRLNLRQLKDNGYS